MLKARYIAMLPLFAAAILGGCKEDDIEVGDSYDRPINVAAPVVNAKSTAMDLMRRWLGGTEWYADDEGVLYTTSEKSYTLTAEEILKSDGINFNANQTLPAGFKNSFSVESVLNSQEDQRIDKIKVLSGYLVIYSPAYETTGTARLTLDEVVDSQGNKLAKDWDLSSGINAKVDLSGYIITPKQSTGKSYLTPTIAVNNRGSESIDFSVEAMTVDFKVDEATGYFGRQVLLDEDTSVRIVAFDRDDFPEGMFFKGTSADVTLASTVGAPLYWKMGTLNFYSRDGKSTALDYSPEAKQIEQQSFADFSQSGSLKEQTLSIHLDDDNSNIEELLNAHPAKYSYSMDLVANPDGEVSGETNFVTSNSSIVTDVNVVLPLWFRISSLDREEMLDLDFSDIFDDETIDYVDTVSIKLTTDNGLPIKIRAQAYFMVGDDVVAGKLFDDFTVIGETPTLDSDDKVTAASHTVVRQPVLGSDIKKYYELGVDKLKFLLNVTTEDTGDRYVKVYQDYKLNSKVSLDIASSIKD